MAVTDRNGGGNGGGANSSPLGESVMAWSRRSGISIAVPIQGLPAIAFVAELDSCRTVGR